MYIHINNISHFYFGDSTIHDGLVSICYVECLITVTYSYRSCEWKFVGANHNFICLLADWLNQKAAFWVISLLSLDL